MERQTRRQSPMRLEGSLVAVDARTGAVLAMVGGRDFRESRFNRATQARRQPGSAFKPLIFAAALERGWSPGSMLRNIDMPIEGPSGPWLPNGEHEASQYTLRRALKVSSNRAAAQLLQSVGVSSALEMARRLGIRSHLPAVPSLALGTGELTLFELTSAYGAFANGGLLALPRLITRVEDADGTLLWENPPVSRRVLSPPTAFLISHILSDVLRSGTAANARSYGFKLPAAGKTGTTDDFADTWFIGYTPKVVTGVWFGFDRPERIMQRGFAAVVAVPAWAKFMKEATAGDAPEWPMPPAGVEKVAICSNSGLLATDYCRTAAAHAITSYEVDINGGIREVPPLSVTEEYFALGDAPTLPCTAHTAWDQSDRVLGTIGTSGEVLPDPAPVSLEAVPALPQPPG
jgi:penicillin-binding protein 1A